MVSRIRTRQATNKLLTNPIWTRITRFNAYAVDLFESIGAEIIYADRILKLRADGHLQKNGGKDKSAGYLLGITPAKQYSCRNFSWHRAASVAGIVARGWST